MLHRIKDLGRELTVRKGYTPDQPSQDALDRPPWCEDS